MEPIGRFPILIKRRRINPIWIPYLLLSPAILMMLVIVFYPILRAVYLSFHEFILWKPTERNFIGIANYLKALRDPIFWLSLKNTAFWVGITVFSQFLLGFTVALLLNQEFKWRGVVRAIVLIPWVTPSVLTALMWTWMYDSNYGVINDILFKLRLIQDFYPWLARPSTALPAIILATIWQGTPFFAIMLLAALQAIPDELYESARVDGASLWQEFKYITVPMVLPTIVITTLLRIIWVANYVDIIYIMTGGGPGYSSLTLAVFTFIQAYKALDFGYAATLSINLALLLMAVVWLYLQYLRKAEMKLR